MSVELCSVDGCQRAVWFTEEGLCRGHGIDAERGVEARPPDQSVSYDWQGRAEHAVELVDEVEAEAEQADGDISDDESEPAAAKRRQPKNKTEE